jgi:lipid II isoglutaminyl synthase (glutamine-hydrolysing)
MNFLIISLGKTISILSNLFGLGNGSTWPGHIAIKLKPDFIKNIIEKSKIKIILVTGTNGKTTTTKILQSILEFDHQKVFINHSGANLLNGVASSLIQKCNFSGNLNYDYAIFEVDENALTQVSQQLIPDYIISLNLFRDQLDRYGEVNTIAKNWKKIYEKLNKTKFILNADDPLIAFLGNGLKSKVYYFGLDDIKYQTREKQHSADSVLCPKCGTKLIFEMIFFSPLGKWKCLNCGLQRPLLKLDKAGSYPLLGTYAVYDTLAAVLTAKLLKVKDERIENALNDFKPAFGRQEEIPSNGRKVQVFLSKNPTSFNESLKTINRHQPKNLLIVLNDRIPDGTDISWIWDVDFEILLHRNIKLYLAGDRAYDLALRVKYAAQRLKTDYILFEDLNEAVKKSLQNTPVGNKLYVLPTYSAMLEVRKILTGKKIL